MNYILIIVYKYNILETLEKQLNILNKMIIYNHIYYYSVILTTFTLSVLSFVVYVGNKFNPISGKG